MRKTNPVTRSLLALAFASVVGCGSDAAVPKNQATSFESDLPSSSSSKAGGRGGAEAVPASDDAGDSSTGTDAQRAIVEADIVQVMGDRLYALSRVAGLT